MAKKVSKKAARPIVTVEPKGYDLKKIYQKIRSENIFEVLDLDPKMVPWMYLSNEIVRSFARCMFQGPYGPVVAKGTKEGALAVVARGGAFDAYERQDYNFVISGAERTTTGTTTGHLIDSGEAFPTEGIKAGDTVFNTTDSTVAYVTAVAVGDLTLDANIMASGESYKLYPCKDFTFSRQIERLDLFTYNGRVDYQLSRDAVQALGSKIPLFEDSFYSLDFYTLRVRGTVVSLGTAGATRSTLFGWTRLEE
jgi:hypothetical protein